MPDERLRVIYNAVDTHTFTPDLRAHRARVRARHRIPARAMVYLHVGSGFERKGVAASIDALAALPAPAHLMVVGKDKHVARYADRARRLGLSGRVTLAGPQPDPRPYFGAADAFVLPTLYDPCPNAALEAMACWLPIVTSTRSGAAELASRTMQASSASRAMPISSRRTCTRCRTAPSAREWVPTAARRCCH